MSRAKAGGYAGGQQQIAALTASLRELAARAEADRAFGAHLLDAVRVSGLATLLAEAAPPPRAQTAKGAGREGPAPSAAPSGLAPFVLLRDGGASGLRAAPTGLPLAALPR